MKRLCQAQSRYDVIADVNGSLFRVQVKSTAKQRNFQQQRSDHISGYMWSRLLLGGLNNRAYKINDFDILALVALDINKIAYLKISEVPYSFQMPISGQKATIKNFENYSFDACIERIRTNTFIEKQYLSQRVPRTRGQEHAL